MTIILMEGEGGKSKLDGLCEKLQKKEKKERESRRTCEYKGEWKDNDDPWNRERTFSWQNPDATAKHLW